MGSAVRLGVRRYRLCHQMHFASQNAQLESFGALPNRGGVISVWHLRSRFATRADFSRSNRLDPASDAPFAGSMPAGADGSAYPPPQAETAEAETALAALQKQRAEADVRLVALGLEANRMIAIRTEGEAVMAHLRAQLQQVSIGQRP